MTDFHAMPDSALNEWIARKQGLPQTIYDKHGFVVDYRKTPDYCNDWKWAGELLEEMKGELIWIEIGNYWGHFPYLMDSETCGESENPKRAISEAYAVMMESMTKTDNSITVDDTGKDGEG